MHVDWYCLVKDCKNKQRCLKCKLWESTPGWYTLNDEVHSFLLNVATFDDLINLLFRHTYPTISFAMFVPFLLHSPASLLSRALLFHFSQLLEATEHGVNPKSQHIWTPSFRSSHSIRSCHTTPGDTKCILRNQHEYASTHSVKKTAALSLDHRNISSLYRIHGE